LDALVKDAFAFVRYFAYPMAQSAPHIYLSALPFAPSSSLIANLYSPRFPRTLGFEYGRLTQWPALVMTISAPHREQVVCVAWSWNDEYIAAGLLGGNVFVWNSLTGTRFNGPFNARTTDREFVPSVVFSHDGLRLASGSSDGRIRIWDLTTGQEAAVGGQPRALEGHTRTVSALSFSKDDKQLISGSADHTVLVWDLEKGGIIAGPFCGHKNPVWAVSFSPDQEHIVSRSGVRTVQVWNAKTGQSVMKPFKDTEIPTGSINSSVYYYSDGVLFESRCAESSFAACSWTEAVECEGESQNAQSYCRERYWIQAATFSRDGKFVATGGYNQTRVWHASGGSTGKLAGGPFNKVNGDALCLAFSADGQRIASGSRCGVVGVWDVGIVDDEARGSAPQELPTSLAFTPDGKQIAVGRRDGTVQVMDASTGQQVVTIKEGNEIHLSPDVASSLDGDLIASTHNACEIRIWSRTGKEIAVPLSSEIVTFSPNSNELVAFGALAPGAVYLLNASTGAVIAAPQQLPKGMTSLALFSSPTNDTATTALAGVRVRCGSRFF